jgi:hypothetical protein
MDELRARLQSIMYHAEKALADLEDQEGPLGRIVVRIELAEIASDLRVALEYAEKLK